VDDQKKEFVIELILQIVLKIYIIDKLREDPLYNYHLNNKNH